ncbi:MAG: hypothetical protein KC478_17175 [Bacteriovoracaceae bacterium]|nr:hypothetical protein [Bacteriovoracaceae bacterium]
MFLKDSLVFQSPGFRVRASATFIVAFASLIYEFVLAQILTTLVGGAIVQYSLTIACFTFCLGIGAYLFGIVEKKFSKDQVFFMTEMALCACALTLPTLALVLHGEVVGLRLDIAVGYISIIIIGLLSGMELPYLMQTSHKKHIILGVDYLAMFVAAVSFPFIFLPKLGTVPTAFVVAGANLVSAFCVVKRGSFKVLGLFVGVVIIVLSIAYHDDINSLSSFFFLRKFNA